MQLKDIHTPIRIELINATRFFELDGKVERGFYHTISSSFVAELESLKLTPNDIVTYLKIVNQSAISRQSVLDQSPISLRSVPNHSLITLQSCFDKLVKCKLIIISEVPTTTTTTTICLERIASKDAQELGSLVTEKATEQASKKRVNFQAEIELIYKNYYPKHEGKSSGIKKLIAEIKTSEQLADFEQAVKNFQAHMAGTEKQFIKLFSTFASCWKDYVDFSPSPILQKPGSKTQVAPRSTDRRPGESVADYIARTEAVTDKFKYMPKTNDERSQP